MMGGSMRGSQAGSDCVAENLLEYSANGFV